mmetsp:Transcript_1602/g.3602  ORF Transcript_1602/g.3602 Transcript_1602/m.3602 type:complete len:170 (-) Transcript_1602:561-1070(-)|eukprot:CAMPEP_0202891398 /NCGR_PEP_ID=MMETSP1392-20130828/1467_1 /ASSEMBLY_ACC=CAM_ASM_000868 /TAXON_ID=225041 /ORGANISM="Chlamydomonas chlamydogama, Strain SAG 11-48b" /LENGTH=169 /DNA_ID=CAMNT_0049575135 /DNA_START=58 /DNA_END=567 /DNA_ORIENTATION=-
MASLLLSSRIGVSAAFGSSRLAPRPIVPARAPLTVTCAYGTTPKIGGGKKWKHTPLTPNGKPEKVKMHIKKGDTVQIVAGKDKGKVGTVVRVLTTTGKCVVEGVNIKTKHIAPRAENEAGQIKKSEYPIHHSNVMLYSKEKGVRSRVGHKVQEDGKKVRYLVKTGEVLP